MLPKSQSQSTAQNFLDIYDITNNFTILKNGVVSITLSVGAMNFGLLAEAEQDAVIYTYAALLNSLNYPIQIIVQSQTKDVTDYLNLLKQQEESASSDLKRDRIARYRQFVSDVIKERNVLDKKFYVTVPASPTELGLISADSFVPGKNSFDISNFEKSIILEKAEAVLSPKRDHLINQFARIGLHSRQLTTQEIIRIFYTSYNPEASEGQELTDTNQYTTPLVRANFINQLGESPSLQQPMQQDPQQSQPIAQQTTDLTESTNTTEDTLVQEEIALTNDTTVQASEVSNQFQVQQPVQETAGADTLTPAPIAQTTEINFQEEEISAQATPPSNIPGQPAVQTVIQPSPTTTQSDFRENLDNFSTPIQSVPVQPAQEPQTITTEPTSQSTEVQEVTTPSIETAQTTPPNDLDSTQQEVVTQPNPPTQSNTQEDELQKTINQALQEVGGAEPVVLNTGSLPTIEPVPTIQLNQANDSVQANIVPTIQPVTQEITTPPVPVQPTPAQPTLDQQTDLVTPNEILVETAPGKVTTEPAETQQPESVTQQTQNDNQDEASSLPPIAEI